MSLATLSTKKGCFAAVSHLAVCTKESLKNMEDLSDLTGVLIIESNLIFHALSNF